MAQLAGLIVMSAIMLAFDWDVRWLTALGVFAGALTTFLVTLIVQRR
jgi:hypothetical protein